ncbi:SH3 and cysteine-rich domain-containing protein 2 24b2/STAC2 [Collichthys lucidus]|uniref:SH3 and cysteine-rich domain-containing protein 2 n=1 Tax=Collichthys lucidus TaxID=240159 RepID=A0A4U5VU40_COLLU|nr:SH3 and cysteine-rich domain-containing protein 2 24b2/STAC2 [Collichthys lucidus]
MAVESSALQTRQPLMLRFVVCLAFEMQQPSILLRVFGQYSFQDTSTAVYVNIRERGPPATNTKEFLFTHAAPRCMAVGVLKERSPIVFNNGPTAQAVPLNLQRLKRSLSFKTIMRSKSVENFFQRSYSDARLPPDFITDPPPPSPPLLPGSPLVSDCSPCISPSLSPNPSISSHSPSLSLSPSLPTKPLRPQITHCFQDHVFRKPTNCQHCKHMIVGNSKQALRCKTCKMAAHLWCTSELSQQPCHGKSGAFKRNFSSPMLVNDQLTVVKEVRPEPRGCADACRPCVCCLALRDVLGADEPLQFWQFVRVTNTQPDTPVPDIEIEKEEEESSGQVQTPAEDNCVKVPKRIEVHSIHTYVALYKFLPQEQNDLELHPGDRVQVTDDSNEEWWKGKSGDKVGFFPANFVQRVRPGERVWRVVQGLPGNRERGHMAVKESQICVGKLEDGEVFLKLSSGKKRGLVPADSIEEI